MPTRCTLRRITASEMKDLVTRNVNRETKNQASFMKALAFSFRLIADRIGAQRRFWDMRKALERNWRHHHQSKLDREEQERSRLRTPGMLLLQQTDPYRYAMGYPFIAFICSLATSARIYM